MGFLTLADYRADLTTAMQRSVATTQQDRWVNNAIKEFAYVFKFRELEQVASFTTVVGKVSYVIGTDIATTNFRAVHEDGLRTTGPTGGKVQLGKLIPEARSSYLRKLGDTADTTTRAQPRYYHKFRNAIYTRPIADLATYTIDFHYWQKVTLLVNPGDTSQFDEDWDEVIFTGALYRGFRAYGEFDRYQNIRNDFLGMVRSRVMEHDMEEFPEGSISPSAGSEVDLISG